MKKIYLSTVALVAFGFANAQIKEKGTIEITPKIGTSSFAEFWDKDTSKYNSGAEFGVTADYYFNNRWSLRSGLIFDKMGRKKC
jgi:long-subunit fatty acid transport protein